MDPQYIKVVTKLAGTVADSKLVEGTVFDSKGCSQAL